MFSYPSAKSNSTVTALPQSFKNVIPFMSVQTKNPVTALRGLLGTPAGGRTLDTLIKSQVLYQLSYGSIVVSGRKITTFFDTRNTFRKLFFLSMITNY